MPLRDHFRPPLDKRRHWGGLHGGWPTMIVANLGPKLPRGYFAEPWVRLGSSAEVDVATFDEGSEAERPADAVDGNGSVATAVWSPPRPTLAAATDLPAQDSYEVRVYDEQRQARLVAAVEIVSPANKDRPEHRRAFVAKCAGLLRELVCVVIVDVVTTRTQSLYKELLDFIGAPDAGLGPEPPPLYAAACRVTKVAEQWQLETWAEGLGLGSPLPTLPLWLADNLAVPLELEETYEQTCRILRLP